MKRDKASKKVPVSIKDLIKEQQSSVVQAVEASRAESLSELAKQLNRDQGGLIRAVEAIKEQQSSFVQAVQAVKAIQAGSLAEQAKRIISEQGGIIRTAEAMRAGIHPRTLYQLRDSVVLDQISRGVYRLADQPPISNPDLVTVATRVPQGVICLISALAFHEITTQIPHSVSIALKKGAETPRLDYPPISIHRFSELALREGVEQLSLDGVPIKIFSPEKTLADCFKFRNKIGMDVVLEALKLYKSRRKVNVGELLKYARICRVENVMRPYLEATI